MLDYHYGFLPQTLPPLFFLFCKKFQERYARRTCLPLIIFSLSIWIFLVLELRANDSVVQEREACEEHLLGDCESPCNVSLWSRMGQRKLTSRQWQTSAFLGIQFCSIGFSSPIRAIRAPSYYFKCLTWYFPCFCWFSLISKQLLWRSCSRFPCYYHFLVFLIYTLPQFISRAFMLLVVQILIGISIFLVRLLTSRGKLLFISCLLYFESNLMPPLSAAWTK